MCLLSTCEPYTPVCYTEPPHRGGIKFKWLWGTNQDKPDSMTVLAYRRINDLRYQFRVSTKNGQGVMLLPQSEVDDIGKRNQMRLRPGEYSLLAFNADKEAYDDNHSIFFDHNAYGEEPKDPFDNIRFTYRVFRDVNESKQLRRFESWVDANPYSGFIISPAHDVFLSKTTCLVNADVNKSVKDVTVNMPMHRLLTQKIKVDFTIASKEEGVIIDSVFAEMSGVCTSVRLGDSSVGVDHTAKVLFRPKVTVTDKEQRNFTCSGDFSCLGIVNAMTEKAISGPGVLQVNIFARCTYIMKEPGLHDGEMIDVPYTVRKNFRASIGLFNTIGANPSLRYNPSTDGFVQTKQDLHYVIKVPLNITREKVLEGDNVSHDIWNPEPTIIYLDI